MTAYDSVVVGFYFAFMLCISWVFRRFVENVSDYFRGGGKALWWMVGGSAFMMSFSAWTLTGAASVAYDDGWPVITIYVANALGFLFNALHFAPKFRQMRVITGIEAVRLRFNRRNEQVFTWLQLPFGILLATLHLNAVAVFVSAVFSFNLSLTIIGVGAIVLCIALLGGSWAVIAGDFIQMLILMPVCICITVLALLHVGGVAGMLAQLPPGHLDLARIADNDFLGLWCVAMVIRQILTTNSLLEANRYLSVKDSRHARWAGLLGAGLYLLGIVVWFVPPFVARILFPDLQALFPMLEHPAEAVFVAITRAVAPIGMLGLLVSGIFAATISAMDSGLNKSAGILIKNFYQPVLRPDASDRHLLLTGRITTVLLGGIIVLTALRMSELRGLNLFIQMQRVSILIGIPVTLPLVLALIVKRTPAWAGWSTALVGFLGSIFIDRYFSPDWAASFFGLSPLSHTAQENWRQSVQLLGNVALGSGWFIFTTLFWEKSPHAYRENVERFITRMATPVDFAAEEGSHAANDDRQARVVGMFTVIYGGFVLLLALIPNPPGGRLAFVGCGGLVLLVGLVLLFTARGRTAAPAPPSARSQAAATRIP